MMTRGKARDLSALLTPPAQRQPACVYFLRLAGWSPEARKALAQLDARARRCGTVLEKGISNPDTSQIAYCQDRLGGGFRLDAAFFDGQLEKWLPAMAPGKRRELAEALLALLREQRAQGKPEGVLKNLYMKLMCWLYYRFRGIADRLGGDPLPLIPRVVP